MQKALELMNLKLTKVLGDATGVTGLKILRAILGRRTRSAGADFSGDRRCKHTEEEIAVGTTAAIVLNTCWSCVAA